MRHFLFHRYQSNSHFIENFFESENFFRCIDEKQVNMQVVYFQKMI